MESGVGDIMKRLEVVAAAEPSHAVKLATVTKENCSPTKSSPDIQSGHKSPTNPDRLQDAAGPLTNKISSDMRCSDRTEMESLQRVSGQTSELSPPALRTGSEHVQVDSCAKTARPIGSVFLPHITRRPITYNFSGTRHESYGNLGIAGLAGLSSTSATLALLPLQASGPSPTTLPSPPVTTSTMPTTIPLLVNTVSSSGNTSLDLPEVRHGGKPVGAYTDVAASVKDRRSTFFSEPPKPISLPTRSASELSSLCDEGFSSSSWLSTNVSSPGSKESNGPSPSVTFPRNLSGSFNSSTAMVLEMQTSPSLLSRQQHSLLAADPSLLCPDTSHAVSGREISPVQFSNQSVASTSDSEDTHFSVWCGPPPDDAAAASVEPALTVDPRFFEIGMFILLQ